MANEETRNFRLIYYDKIGCKRKDEKGIDKLLEEKPIDLNKLNQYVQKFGLTNCKRLIVWQTLLGIVTHIEEDDKFIKKIHENVCLLLEKALTYMEYINSESPRSTKILLMYILENKDFSLEINKQPSQEILNLTAIANTFVEYDFPFTDTYWLMKAFLNRIEDQKQVLMKMAQKFTNEDKDLEKHLKETGAIDVLPLSIWFSRCYSSIIHRSSLTRIWDLIIAGYFKILPIVAQYILKALKDDLMAMSSPTDIRKKLLEQIPSNISENIVAKILEN